MQDIRMNTLDDIKQILDNLKPIEKYIATLKEGSYEYESICEDVMEYFIKIEEVLIGNEEYNPHNVCNCDIRMFTYWKYLKGNMKFETLLKKLKERSNGLKLSE